MYVLFCLLRALLPPLVCLINSIQESPQQHFLSPLSRVLLLHLYNNILLEPWVVILCLNFCSPAGC